MNLRQLETFIWVSTLGSFRKAAAKLNTSQPAISSRISALEDQLGVKLFERHAGSFELTPKGVELLPAAQKLLTQAQQFKEKASQSEAMSGILRLGVSETIVHTWLSDFLKLTHEKFPNLNIEVTVDVTANMRNELINRSLDLAFLLGPISEYSIHNLDLCSFDLAWVCSPELGLHHKKLTLKDILTKPVMTYARNTRPFAEIEALSKTLDVEDVRLFPSTSLAAAIRMSQDGLGIGMLPLATIREEVANGELVLLDCDHQPSALQFTASYAREPFNPIAEKMGYLAMDIARLRD